MRCEESPVSKTKPEPSAAEDAVESVTVETPEPVDEVLEEAIVEEASARVQWFTLTLFLIVVGGIGGLGWLGWQELSVVRSDQAALAARLAQTEQALQNQTVTASDLRALQSEVARLTSELSAARSDTRQVIERMESLADQRARATADTRSESLLAEAEYLLKLADQRLLVERNPDVARPLMQSAQAVLGEVEDNRLLPVREKLATDLQALASVETVDVMGMQAEILALDSLLDRLQLPTRRLVDAPVIGADRNEPVGSWLGPLADFIRIREVEAPIAPLVNAADAGRAREILRLNLEQIKLALLREDQALFDSAVASAVRLTRHYFNTVEGPGLGVLQTLEGLAGQSIMRSLPDASSGLRALKQFRQMRMTDASGPSEQTP